MATHFSSGVHQRDRDSRVGPELRLIMDQDSFDVRDFPANILFQHLADLVGFLEVFGPDDDACLQKAKSAGVSPD